MHFFGNRVPDPLGCLPKQVHLAPKKTKKGLFRFSLLLMLFLAKFNCPTFIWRAWWGYLKI